MKYLKFLRTPLILLALHPRLSAIIAHLSFSQQDAQTLPTKISDFSDNLNCQHEKAKTMLEHVKLGKFIDRFPNQISGGMQQRVAIARALINEPTLILADEPTGNLDTKTSIEIMDLFTELNKEGKTIVLVTHEPDIANYAKRLIYILDGVLHYDGPVSEFKGKK